ncbi:T9SS type A sorting domain-containing protein [candidate division WOR-3 bacterium]|nr:T9SS type A sorting domain-containing protein [candidate division WOR-3 bacterium]
MYYRNFITALAVLILAGGLFADAPDTLWTKTYGGEQQDTAYSVCPTSDGGYVIAGITNSMGAGDCDGYLVKTDSAGNLDWEQTYGSEFADGFFNVLETSDGHYLVSGWTSITPFNTDSWLVKVDALGNVVWEKTYGGGDIDSTIGMVPTHDGNYLAVGYSVSYATEGYADAWVLKFDPETGDTLWAKTYNYSTGSGDFFVSGCQTPDDGFLFTGATSVAVGNWDTYVVKTDSFGVPMWSRSYHWGVYDRVFSACQTSDGSYLITGTANLGQGEVLILKMDEAGDTVWTKLYGGEGEDRSWGICPSGDTMFFVSGRTSSFGSGGYDLWILAIDTEGDTLWTDTYGGTGDEWCYFPIMNAKGNLMLPAYTTSWGAGGADFWLLEYGCEEEPGVTEVLIDSPIRITTYFNRLSYEITNEAQLTLYSADGRRVLTETLKGKGVWEASDAIPAGVYFARVDSGMFSTTKRLIVIR